MKQLYLLWVAVCLSFLLTGCGIEPALSGQAREDYLKSIKPYIEYWEKDGVTREERARDAIGCGGSNRGTDFSRQQLDAARREGENDWVVRSRLANEWQRCMLRHGYRYTGKCYDNEIGRTSPACAGRVLEPLR